MQGDRRDVRSDAAGSRREGEGGAGVVLDQAATERELPGPRAVRQRCVQWDDHLPAVARSQCGARPGSRERSGVLSGRPGEEGQCPADVQGATPVLWIRA
ncbi:hypothetical protein GCM10025734_14350 [Kitasatospora paranensis]